MSSSSSQQPQSRGEGDHRQQQQDLRRRWHGRVGAGYGWERPTRTLVSSQKARPEYTDVESHEYEDVPHVLEQKVAVLAEQFIREARCCVAYTGAGLSVPSGLDDYATAGGASVRQVGVEQERGSGYFARPSVGHEILAALYWAGYVRSFVNQNHDGLLQKAGIPPQDVNEIHGSWFDPSNPGGNILRDDLFEDLLEAERSADMCLTMGSSLSGLNADRLPRSASRRRPGLVIVNLQATPLDDICNLRIFARIEVVLTMLAERLGLQKVPTATFPLDVFRSLPYDPRTGERVVQSPLGRVGGEGNDSNTATTATTKTTDISLTNGSKIRIVRGPYANCVGVVERRADDGWEIRVVQTITTADDDGGPGSDPHHPPVTITDHHWLGAWWIKAARQGLVRYLPVVPDDGS